MATGNEAVPAAAPEPEVRDFAAMERLITSGPFAAPLKIAIVGLPNVGKTGLFNLVTTLYSEGDHNVVTSGTRKELITFHDELFDWLCDCYDPERKVWPMLEITDTPGIVRGSFLGEGAGNDFMSDIRDADGIMHVLRAFEDNGIVHVDGNIKPIRDLMTINEELRIKDREFVIEKLDKIDKTLKQSNIEMNTYVHLKSKFEFLLNVLDFLRDGNDIRLGDWDENEIKILKDLNLLTAKPVTYVLNVSAKDYGRGKSKFRPEIWQWVQAHDCGSIIPFCCTAGQVPIRMLPRIVKDNFEAVKVIFFFTASAHEVRCVEIKERTRVPQAAGAVHPNLEKGFLWAEVIKFEDLKELGSEAAVKAAGRYQKVDKMYEVQHGDVTFFKSYIHIQEPVSFRG